MGYLDLIQALCGQGFSEYTFLKENQTCAEANNCLENRKTETRVYSRRDYFRTIIASLLLGSVNYSVNN